MLHLIIHSNAKQDLLAIRVRDRGVAADLVVALQEIQGDQNLLDRLSQQRYSFENGHWIENIDVQQFAEQQRAGRNLWRLKFLDLEREGLPYRVIYAFVTQRFTYHVLAVVHRDDYNYEPTHPITLRIVRDLADLQ